jgi:hypothetical protein
VCGALGAISARRLDADNVRRRLAAAAPAKGQCISTSLSSSRDGRNDRADHLIGRGRERPGGGHTSIKSPAGHARAADESRRRKPRALSLLATRSI